MKKAIQLLSVLCLSAFLLAGCSKNTPKQVAEQWLNGFNHLDFESAREVSTDDTKKLLNELEQLTTRVADSNKKDLKKITVTVKDVKKLDSSKAVATYVTSDNPGRDQTLNLVKVNDKWLVQFSKIDLMGVPGQGSEEIEGDNTAAQDSLSNSSMDTTKGVNQ